LLPARAHAGDERGVAVVEFSLALVPLALLLFGILDLGRGVYTYSATAQAAREIARAVSVDPYGDGATLGGSVKARAAIKVHAGCDSWPTAVGCGSGQVPGLVASDIAISCVDVRDQVITGTCRSGSYVRVVVALTFQPVTPLVGEFPMPLRSVSHARLS
jgi:hypothetical protein